MRSLCLALLVVSVVLASTQAKAAKQKVDKRLLGDLLGGDLLGGLLGGDLLGDLLGGDLLGDLLGGDLLGGVLDSLLGDDGLLGSILNIKEGLIPALLGENGILGSLLDNILGNELLSGLIGSDSILGGLADALDEIVAEVTSFVSNLVEIVLRALEGVDLNDIGAVRAVFDRQYCNQLCPACAVIPQAATAQACFEYCRTTCRWAFPTGR